MAKKIKIRRIYRTKKRSTRTKVSIPLAVVAGLACPVVKAVKAYQYAGAMGQQGLLASITESFTGYNPIDQTWHATRLKSGLLPVVAGIGVHKLAGYLGINRAIAQAGIPLIRI